MLLEERIGGIVGGGRADRSEVLGGCCPDDCMREENRKKKEL